MGSVGGKRLCPRLGAHPFRSNMQMKKLGEQWVNPAYNYHQKQISDFRRARKNELP